jgi:hypothetical protein
MELFDFLTGTTLGKCVFTMLVSMLPIIELRGGLPFGVALGLPYHLAFPAAVIGKCNSIKRIGIRGCVGAAGDG